MWLGGKATAWAALALCILGRAACAQTSGPHAPSVSRAQAAQPASRRSTGGEVTLRGCLQGNRYLAADSGKIYRLSGDTSVLIDHDGEEVLLRGHKFAASRKRPDQPIFQFVGLLKVIPRPTAKLNPLVRNSRRWREYTNKKYGLSYSVPDFFPAAAASQVLRGPQFVNNQGVVALGSFSIPTDTYSHAAFAAPSGYHPTVFAGGAVGLFVNPKIANRFSCLQFKIPYTGKASWWTVHGIRYREQSWFGEGMGTGHSTYTFHTFRNGACFAVTVDMAQVNVGMIDQGCMLPFVSPRQEHDLARRLLSRLAFFRPRNGPSRQNASSSTPAVVSFSPSSLVADDATNRGTIIFSWATRNADYVELSYRCTDTDGEIVILEAAKSRQCENARSPIPSESAWQEIPINYSPDGSATVIFGNRRDSPAAVHVIVTPFSRGKAYPDSSKSVTITVDPFNAPTNRGDERKKGRPHLGRPGG